VKVAARIASRSAGVGPSISSQAGDLDLAHRFKPCVIGPQVSELRARVAVDHRPTVTVACIRGNWDRLLVIQQYR
jgi:hypothetical protein